MPDRLGIKYNARVFVEFEFEFLAERPVHHVRLIKAAPPLLSLKVCVKYTIT
jgi:hypothetical protein